MSVTITRAFCGVVLAYFSCFCERDTWANDANQLLNRVANYYSTLGTVQFRIQDSSSRIGDISKPEATRALLSEQDSSVAWDSTGRFTMKSTSQARGKEYKTDVAFDGKRFVSGGTDPELTLALTSIMKPSWTKPEQAREISRSSVGFLLGFHRGEFLDKERGLEPLCEVVRKKGSLRQIDENSFESTQDRYAIRVTCDPQRGFAPSRIEYRLLKAPSKDEPRVVVEVSTEVLAFGEFNGKPFPIEIVEKRRLSEGIEFNGESRPASLTVSQANVSSVKLNEELTDSDFAFELPVPDYTPVHMLDAPALRFYWLKGEIVPATDEEAARIAKNAVLKKIERRGFWQRYGWVLGIVVVCIALYFVLDRVRRKRS